jgi:hypothetical protein
MGVISLTTVVGPIFADTFLANSQSRLCWSWQACTKKVSFLYIAL